MMMKRRMLEKGHFYSASLAFIVALLDMRIDDLTQCNILSSFFFFTQGFAPGNSNLLPSPEPCFPRLGSSTGSHPRGAGPSSSPQFLNFPISHPQPHQFFHPQQRYKFLGRCDHVADPGPRRHLCQLLRTGRRCRSRLLCPRHFSPLHCTSLNVKEIDTI